MVFILDVRIECDQVEFFRLELFLDVTNFRIESENVCIRNRTRDVEVIVDLGQTILGIHTWKIDIIVATIGTFPPIVFTALLCEESMKQNAKAAWVQETVDLKRISPGMEPA